ncbi:MAG: hypothetical protein JNG84_05375 [Archangium sp.]|nr:hypothetical protein [Archangium sp.]
MRPLLVGMLMFAACTAAIPPLDGAFACSTSGDCVAGFVCFARVCTPEGAVPPEVPDAGQPLDADYLRVISRAELLGYERPSLAQQRVHARFVGELKDAGVWPLLDALYVMMASTDDGRFSTLNWKDPARFQLVPMGAPSWTRWDATHKIGGWTAPDAGSYLDTTIAANARVGIERDVGYAVALDTPAQAPGRRAAYGAALSGGWTLMRPGGGGGFEAYVYGESFGFNNPADVGLYVNTRRELEVVLFKDGRRRQARSMQPALPRALSLYLLGWNYNGGPAVDPYTVGNVSLFSVGRDLSDVQEAYFNAYARLKEEL